MNCPECGKQSFNVETDKSITNLAVGEVVNFDFSVGCNDCGEEISVSTLRIKLEKDGMLSLVGFMSA